MRDVFGTIVTIVRYRQENTSRLFPCGIGLPFVSETRFIDCVALSAVTPLAVNHPPRRTFARGTSSGAWIKSENSTLEDVIQIRSRLRNAMRVIGLSPFAVAKYRVPFRSLFRSVYSGSTASSLLGKKNRIGGGESTAGTFTLLAIFICAYTHTHIYIYIYKISIYVDMCTIRLIIQASRSPTYIRTYISHSCSRNSTKTYICFPTVSQMCALSPLRELSKIDVHEGNNVSIHSHRGRSRKPPKRSSPSVKPVSLRALLYRVLHFYEISWYTHGITCALRHLINFYERSETHGDAESSSQMPKW